MAAVPQTRFTAVPNPKSSAENKGAAVPGPLARVTFKELAIDCHIKASIGSDVVDIGLTIDKHHNVNRSYVLSTKSVSAGLQADIETKLSELLMALALAAYNGQRAPSALQSFSSGV